MPSASYVLGKLLERMGQKVRTAQSVAEALESARKDRPDLIISDIGMPDSDGYDLARQVRHDPALRSIALVALTGYGQDSDRQKTREAGFDHHLVKPVSVDTLETLLSSLPPSSGKRASRGPMRQHDFDQDLSRVGSNGNLFGHHCHQLFVRRQRPSRPQPQLIAMPPVFCLPPFVLVGEKILI